MIIDLIAGSNRYESIHPNLKLALNYLRTTDFSVMEPGKYTVSGDDVFAILSDYQTKDRQGTRMEAHRIYTDIHFLIAGDEWIGYLPPSSTQPDQAYNPDDDYMLYDMECGYTQITPGMIAIFFPPELHKPSIFGSHPQPVRKVVMKVRTT